MKFTFALLIRIRRLATTTTVPAASPKAATVASAATSSEPAISAGVSAVRKATLIRR